MKWALAAFEPFAGAATNASLLTLERLRPDLSLAQFELLPPLPVTFRDAWPRLRNELERRPHLGGVLCFGQAAGRTRVDLERVALNYVDTATPDNEGIVPPLGRLRDDADVRWCEIPWANLTSSACGRSYSAGTYVCNALYYDLLAWAAAGRRLAGFIHVPVLKSQTEFAAHSPVDDDRVLEGVRDALAFVATL